jgi:hypothetical protein
MKWRNYLYSLLGCLLLASCYNEDTLTTAGDENIDRFEFPQGSNTWDEDIQDIFDQYGVMLIYKGITATDLSRSWISYSSTNSRSDELKDEDVKFVVDYLKNHIFAYLSPKVTSKVFKPYWFLLENYFNGGRPAKSNYNGMDFWALCMHFTEEVYMEQTAGSSYEAQWNKYKDLPSTKSEYFSLRGSCLYKILGNCVTLGNITIPEEYDEGFDYSTEFVTNDPTSENYPYTRGFITSSDLFGYFYLITSKKPVARVKNFFQYIHLGFYYSEEEIETKFPRTTYPFLREKLDIVKNHLKTTYGIDLQAIHDGPEIN